MILTDEEVLTLWSGDAPRPVMGKNKVIAFARAIEAAVLAKLAAPGEDDTRCPTCGEDGGTSCGAVGCGLLTDPLAAQYAKLAGDVEPVATDEAWDFADKVWREMDRRSMPGIYMQIVTKAVAEMYPKRDASALAAAQAEVERLKEHLSFVERWAVHHGTKPHMTPEDALSVIQHYPPIAAITKSYTNGKTPDTPNPWSQLAAEQAKVRELVEVLRMVQECAIDMRGDDFNLTTEQWTKFHAAIAKHGGAT